MSQIELNDTSSATNGSITRMVRQRRLGRWHSANRRPLTMKITAMLSRWVWVMLSISAYDLGNFMAASLTAVESLPRYCSATPGGVIPVV
jgi:hypothetical protein